MLEKKIKPEITEDYFDELYKATVARGEEYVIEDSPLPRRPKERSCGDGGSVDPYRYRLEHEDNFDLRGEDDYW